MWYHHSIDSSKKQVYCEEGDVYSSNKITYCKDIQAYYDESLRNRDSECGTEEYRHEILKDECRFGFGGPAAVKLYPWSTKETKA